MLDLPNYYEELFQRLDPNHPNCLSVDRMEEEGHSIIDNLCEWYKYFYDEVTREMGSLGTENFDESIGRALGIISQIIPTEYIVDQNTSIGVDFNYGTVNPLYLGDSNASLRKESHFFTPYARMGFAACTDEPVTTTTYNSQDLTTTCTYNMYEIAGSTMNFAFDVYSATDPEDCIEILHEPTEIDRPRLVIEGEITTSEYAWWAFGIKMIREAGDGPDPQETLEKFIEYGLLTGDGGYTTIADMPDAVLAGLIDFDVLQDLLDDNLSHIQPAAYGMRQCFHVVKYDINMTDLFPDNYIQSVFICDPNITRVDEYDAANFGDEWGYAEPYWRWYSMRHGNYHDFNCFLSDVNGITDLSQQGFIFTTAEQYEPMPQNPSSNDTVTKTFRFVAIGNPVGDDYIGGMEYNDYLDYAFQYRNWDMIMHYVFERYIHREDIFIGFVCVGKEYALYTVGTWEPNPFTGINVEKEYVDWTGEEYQDFPPFGKVTPPSIAPKKHHRFVPYFLDKHKDVLTKDNVAAAFGFSTMRTLSEQSQYTNDSEFREECISAIKTYMASKWPEFNELND